MESTSPSQEAVSAASLLKFFRPHEGTSLIHPSSMQCSLSFQSGHSRSPTATLSVFGRCTSNRTQAVVDGNLIYFPLLVEVSRDTAFCFSMSAFWRPVGPPLTQRPKSNHGGGCLSFQNQVQWPQIEHDLQGSCWRCPDFSTDSHTRQPLYML